MLRTPASICFGAPNERDWFGCAFPLDRAETRGGDRHPSRSKKSASASVDCVIHDVFRHLWASLE
jgi:hypothetical protein